MKEQYQNLARRFRPQTFADVIGQERIVTTLMNALSSKRVSHAYLFCGGRGSGKTTLARIFAKALNCTSPIGSEPCNQCKCCTEIINGSSLDVIEIDGASNRGIDDIRHINETACYAPSSGSCKIYIIDEVHMLTKEAFNALLKTLEEPPKNVKFFFATTEPHKVLPTIISRCQRFDLKRISSQDIVKKLKSICIQVERDADEGALRLIASTSDGSMRDAESFLDQILCFEEGTLKESSVCSALGITSKDDLFALDDAIHASEISFAFRFVDKLHESGKDLGHFLDELLTHFRHHLSAKILGNEVYGNPSNSYTQEELLFILDLLIDAKADFAKSSTQRVHLEALLLKVLRSKGRISIESLIARLADLEQRGQGVSETSTLSEKQAPQQQKTNSMKAPEAQIEESSTELVEVLKTPEEQSKAPILADQTPKEESSESTAPPKMEAFTSEASEQKLDTSESDNRTKTEATRAHEKSELIEIPFCTEEKAVIQKSKAELDTLLRFAAVELEGTINHQ